MRGRRERLVTRSERSLVIHFADAAAALPGPAGERAGEDLAVWVMFYGPTGGESP